MAYNKETGTYEGYIYLILNDVHPEKIYVGQTIQDPKKRWNCHRGEMRKHTYTDKIHNAMEKYGIEHFAMEVIEECKLSSKKELIERLDEREKYYISFFDSYYNGYNATKGGRDGVEHQTRSVKRYSLDGDFIAEYESIDNLKTEFDSVSSIYDCCQKNNCKYAYGSIWRYSEDELTNDGLLTDLEKKEATTRYLALFEICKYRYDGTLIATYKNVKEACEKNNVSRHVVINNCVGNTKRSGLYTYRFISDSFNKYDCNSEKPRICEQYDLDGNFIKAYTSTREASRQTGIKNTGISANCRHEGKTAGGFIWKYAGDDWFPNLDYNAHCIPIYVYDKNTFHLVNKFNSIQDASVGTGLNIATISKQARCLNNVGNVKYICSFNELSIDELKKRIINKNSKSVLQFTKDKRYIASFDSILDAGRQFPQKNANVHIGAACRKIKKSAYGYLWYFENDEDCPIIKTA